MKKTLGIAAATALAIGALAAPAMAGQPAHGEMAFGAGIKYHCGASYGQLVSAARAVRPHQWSRQRCQELRHRAAVRSSLPDRETEPRLHFRSFALRTPPPAGGVLLQG